LGHGGLVAASLLAGVRNDRPRPSVGFKFHAVLVVNSVNLASLADATSKRCLPVLRAPDYFKHAPRAKEDFPMNRPTRQTRVASIVTVLLALLAAAPANSQSLAPTLRPKAVPLPFTPQGPFVAMGDLPVHKTPVASPPTPGGIVMFGDSTTATRRGAVKKVYAERVQDSLQGIGSMLSVHNAGVPSNTTTDARDRLATDVLTYKPRVVVIQFGINDAAVDVWKNPPATSSRVPLSEFERNLRWMITTLRDQKAKPVLMTTNPTRWTSKLRELYGRPPYRPDDADGFDAPVLSRYNETVRRLAKELAVPLVDVHDAFTAKNSDRLLLDGMHPNDDGHQTIAELLLPVIREQVR
jgi:lysophospholipase L1-like esterase